MLGDEVLEGGHHAVAGPALLLGVAHGRVEALAGMQLLHPRVDPGPGVGLAELGGDPLGGVVEVAPAVGPQHVVEDEHRQIGAVTAGALGEQPQLVVDRVPVVVAVDQGGVDGPQGGEHVEAERPGGSGSGRGTPARAPRGRTAGRVDDVQLGVGAEVVEHPNGGLAPQRADLDDAPCAGGVQHWCDGDIPQREHGRATRLPQRCEERAG